MEEYAFIFLAINFVLSIPGIFALIFWIKRPMGNVPQKLAEQPEFPWWAKGFIGQLISFFTLKFWIAIGIGIVLLILESIFNFEISLKTTRSIDFGIIGGCIALSMQLYQRASNIALPPHLNRLEKKSLKKIFDKNSDINLSASAFQNEISNGLFQNSLPPLTSESINFYAPDAPHSLLGSVNWDQVVYIAYFSNKFIVLALDDSAPQALKQVLYGKKKNLYRLYFSTKKALKSGIKMQALAKHFWFENYISSSKNIHSTSQMPRNISDIFK